MLILLVSIFVGLALTYSCFRDRKIDPKLTEKRAPVPTVGVQIICGDCAGDSGSPRKTYVDQSGRCSVCGGGSYMLAARRGFSIMPLNEQQSHFTGQTEASNAWSPARDQEEWGAPSAFWGAA